MIGQTSGLLLYNLKADDLLTQGQVKLESPKEYGFAVGSYDYGERWKVSALIERNYVMSDPYQKTALIPHS